MRACPDCNGTGKSGLAIVCFSDRHRSQITNARCPSCNGSGQVSDEQQQWAMIGEAHRKARIERLESLRECARRLRISPTALSKMERGIIDPSKLSASGSTPG